ncbi:hypothetical protein M440DRAFT_1402888 [Trichoderma longibrachiatum ATCC 18648]|uniref:Phenylalanine--tRNA ligase beta subunit n=1 Tax=Trichoderma longibrachiatum ATCC 18648 TaxID=983965 RepID=A0A2T4C1B2_TRILO|nr:hypothetical protein M440DRAFT_1402888 [Trichoderma longibrachiatum ATCC 18648]
MPTISVDKYKLYEALGRKFTTAEFEDLCFEFGIELDEDTEDQERPIVNGEQEPPQLKIEIPANRYDMLCFEGIALNLNIFLGRTKPPNFRVVEPKDGLLQTITVSPEVAKVRPYVAGAILRNITFTKDRYESFIALQDKLHQNLARQRTLVSIGTHDLDTIKGPFTYEALPPKDFKFVPLNQTHELTGEALMAFYENDRHLGRYLHIIRDAPVYPLILDSNRVICSLPPIINGDHSKITLNTTNVFIEITATDLTKLEIVTDMMVTMFSEYCAEPFTVEPVKIISDHNNQTRITPHLRPRVTHAEVDCDNARAAAAWCGKSSGFEVVHGLLDRLMLMLRTDFVVGSDDSGAADDVKPDGYWIEELNEDTFFHGHAAAVYLRLGGKEQRIGEFGILHPSVLEKFDLRFPVSTLEINLEVFL